MPKLCEKCGQYDPTRWLTPASRCPRCGVVYAKLPRPSDAVGSTRADFSRNTDASTFERCPSAFEWAPLKPIEVWLSIAAACALFAVILFDEDGFILLLDHANLAFHEAGHFLFGMLSRSFGLYGGTLGQLVFPVIACVSCWQRHQAVGVALSGIWLFENFLNIARYMADARAQLLPLVGGGEHDWYHIFSRWGLLSHDTDIAAVTSTIGWLGMIGCLIWLWRQSRANARTQEQT